MKDHTAGSNLAETDVGGDKAASEKQVSLLELVAVLLRRRHEFWGWTLGTAVVVVLFALLTFDPTYTSEASFIPQAVQRGGGVGLEAVAGQLGINVSTESGSESPQFYADLLRTRELLRPLLSDTLLVERGSEEGPRTGNLLDLLEIEGDTRALREEMAMRWLREEAVSTSVTRETGLVRVSVTSPWPTVSQGIADRLLELAHAFNLQTRQSQASAERQFIQARLSEARAELRAAEDELKGFLENNRQFQNSPQLTFEHDRLQRRVSQRQQLVNSLSQSYEQARIAEVRNTPLITVVEPPESPVRRDPRGLLLKGVLGLILGAMLGVFFILSHEMISRSRERGDEDFQRLSSAWEETRAEVVSLFQRRRGSRSRSDEPR